MRLEEMSKEELIQKIYRLGEINDHMATMLMEAEKELRQYQKAEEKPLLEKI